MIKKIYLHHNVIVNLLIIALILSYCRHSIAAAIPDLFLPTSALNSNELAVIVNDADPLSVRIANYYQQRRNIPPSNIIHIRFNPGLKTIPVDQFRQLKQTVDKQTPAHIQAYALTWMLPYRVGCMSITTAFTAGYDKAFCAQGCQPTRSSPYFNSKRDKPYDAYKWRPSMLIAAENFTQAQQLIDRGIESDFTYPSGTAYLLKTSDKHRSSRAMIFFETAHVFKNFWDIKYLEQDFIENKHDIMFYFTGLAKVPNINKNSFLPGAVADHLTSTGGILSGSKQMSALEWLKAGATGSYGAVVEPCNFVQKFPHPGVLMYHYIRGASLIEAYWKSVAWPGQGIFIGEPLAKPFAVR